MFSNVEKIEKNGTEHLKFTHNEVEQQAEIFKDKSLPYIKYREEYYRIIDDDVEIKNGSDYIKCIFLGNADFSDATFKKNANFSNAKFKKDADFSNAKFKKDIWFDGLVFNGKALFTKASFDGDAGFDGCKFHKKAYFDKVNIKDKFIFSGVELSPESKLNLKSLKTSYMDYLDTDIKNVANRETFTILKSIASNQHDNMGALDFHTKEMNKYLQETNNKWHSNIILKFEKLVSNFGTSLWKPLLWLVGASVVALSFLLCRFCFVL